jgi:hypothetical protein
MYEDDKLWPIKCPACGEEFEKEVGWLKMHDTVKCPADGCPTFITIGAEEFSLRLAQARQGLFDPYSVMMRISRDL